MKEKLMIKQNQATNSVRHAYSAPRAANPNKIGVFGRYLRAEDLPLCHLRACTYAYASNASWSTFHGKHVSAFATYVPCDFEYGLNHPKIGSYLAGLWEGDGHIVLPKQIASDQSLQASLEKKNTPCLAITFPEKDLPLVDRIAQKYKGWIRRKIKERALVYTITKQSDLLNIVREMNGFLRTPKIYEFNELLFFLNNKCKANLQIHPVDSSSLSENYWLSGFIEADGGFKIRYTPQKMDVYTKKVITKRRIEVKFKLEQRRFHAKTGASFEQIMRFVSIHFFAVNLNRSRHNGRYYWNIEVASISKLQKLVDYLERFPLLSAKFNDFQDWKKAFQLVKEGCHAAHLSELGASEIFFLKSNMNRKRSVFDWSHLTKSPLK
jgi:hypothetical protein